MPTVEDTRIDEIGKIILDHRYEKDPRDMDALKYSSYLIAKKILEYMAPTIEKAEKWDKVKEIAKRIWKDSCCEDCPVEDRCDSTNSLCGQMDNVVDALEGGKSENKS
jgi:hypothetical protein